MEEKRRKQSPACFGKAFGFARENPVCRDGEFRRCFFIGDKVYKIPNPDRLDPIGAFGSQFIEVAAVDIKYRDRLDGIRVAEGETIFHESGAPIVVMEKVETRIDSNEFIKPSWYHPNLISDADLRKRYYSDPNYDVELHSQIGFSYRSKRMVFFDVGCVPESGMSFKESLEELSRSSLYWPGRSEEIIESLR